MLKVLVVLSLLCAPTADSIAGTWQITGDPNGYRLSDVRTMERIGTALSGTCALEGRKPSELTGEAKDGKFTFARGVEGDTGTSTSILSGSLASPTRLAGTVTVKQYPPLAVRRTSRYPEASRRDSLEHPPLVAARPFPSPTREAA